jgi:hypothetical protein
MNVRLVASSFGCQKQRKLSLGDQNQKGVNSASLVVFRSVFLAGIDGLRPRFRFLGLGLSFLATGSESSHTNTSVLTIPGCLSALDRQEW